MNEQGAGTSGRRRQATQVGTVMSDKMTKSVVVLVERTVPHGLYRRYIQRSARYMVHDEEGRCRVGDTVEIVESRPLSARKRWRVRRVLRSSKGSE